MRHYILLHLFRDHNQPEQSVNSSVTEISNSNENSPVATSSQSNNFCGTISSATNGLLSTAVLKILDERGNYQRIRTLLDCGSQTSYISQKCFNQLGLPRVNC